MSAARGPSQKIKDSQGARRSSCAGSWGRAPELGGGRPYVAIPAFGGESLAWELGGRM